MVILRVPTEMIDGILRRALCPIFIFLSTFDSPESKSELIRIERLKPTMGIQEIYQNILTNRDGKNHSLVRVVTGFNCLSTIPDSDWLPFSPMKDHLKLSSYWRSRLVEVKVWKGGFEMIMHLLLPVSLGIPNSWALNHGLLTLIVKWTVQESLTQAKCSSAESILWNRVSSSPTKVSWTFYIVNMILSKLKKDIKI